MHEPRIGEHWEEDQILDYWVEIASAWATTVRAGGIESRERVTNASIIRAILDRQQHSVLDLGCGDGWLCRALGRHGIRTIGVDAIPELISKAKAADSGEYHVMTYRQLAA